MNKEMTEGIEIYHENGERKTKVQGSSRAVHVGGNKADQEKIGRQMARDRHTDHTIKRMDGTIGEKNSDGNDPNPPKDKK